MEYFNKAYEWLLSQGGIPGLLVMGMALAAFVLQLWYWLRAYGCIASSRRQAGNEAEEQEEEGLSVIIALRNADYIFLEETLPLILAQNYEEFEVVLIDMAEDADFSFSLTMVAEREPRVCILRLSGAPVQNISHKMALNVGIRGAKYGNLVFTTVQCRPVSEKWLTAMARGFRRGDVVIGYCGLHPDSAGGNWARVERVAWSARWLGAAVRGRAYRGNICNLGFTRKTYYDHEGFDWLKLNIGEDDLFVQQLARHVKVSVVTAGKASVRQSLWGIWYKEKKLASATFRFYPVRAKIYIGAELWSRALFFAAALWMIVAMPFEIKIAGAVMVAARLTAAWLEMYRICRRLSERGLMWLYPAYDMAAPVLEAWLAIDRTFRKTEGLWR